MSFAPVAVVYAVAQSGLGVARQRLQVWTNLGIGLGAVLGGLALPAGTPAAYAGVLVVDASGFLLAGVLLTRLPAPRPVAAGSRTTGARPSRGVWQDRPHLVVAGLHAVLYLYMPTLSVVLPLFVASRTAAPTWTIAVAFVVNTVGVLALQVRAARRVTDVAGAAAGSRRGGVGIALSCLVFGLAALPQSTGTGRVGWSSRASSCSPPPSCRPPPGGPPAASPRWSTRSAPEPPGRVPSWRFGRARAEQIAVCGRPRRAIVVRGRSRQFRRPWTRRTGDRPPLPPTDGDHRDRVSV